MAVACGCNIGLCGPDVDQTLVTFSADLQWLRQHGAQISRHNFAQDPMTFAGNDTVKQFLEVAGSAGLPLVLIDVSASDSCCAPGYSSCC